MASKKGQIEGARIERDETGKLKPGSHLNPTGRTKGVERWVRDFIAEQFEKHGQTGEFLNGWQAMTMMMFDIAMGRRPPGIGDVEIKIKDRQEAVKFLFDRAYGKAKIFIESENTVTPGALANINPENLDARELDALEAYVESFAAKLNNTATSKVLDIIPDPDPDDLP